MDDGRNGKKGGRWRSCGNSMYWSSSREEAVAAVVVVAVAGRDEQPSQEPARPSNQSKRPSSQWGVLSRQECPNKSAEKMRLSGQKEERSRLEITWSGRLVGGLTLCVCVSTWSTWAERAAEGESKRRLQTKQKRDKRVKVEKSECGRRAWASWCCELFGDCDGTACQDPNWKRLSTFQDSPV